MWCTVKSLQVTYGQVLAVRDFSLTIAEGEHVALIGANGAGKTSALKAIAGLLKPFSGQVLWQGQDVTGRPAHLLQRQGISLVPEGRGIFAHMSVFENLMMGAYCRSDRSAVLREIKELYAVLPRLAERTHQKAGTLSGGEQQMMVIARALLAKPRLLLLDEPSMGLAPVMVSEIFRLIARSRQQGVAVLLVEQNARLALSVTERAYVLENGSLVMQGDSSQLCNDPRIKEAYLGV